ncbi:MAG TPA: chemotaxis protein CheD [Aliidongia sp.]|nr:chemotaxis protein CheD [Aliidongia sp.]
MALDPIPAFDLSQQLFLLSAAIHCSREPMVISTVLGSCVAVCLWDTVQRIGGMNHFVLPRSHSDGPDSRYGDSAIDQLVDRMLDLGCRRETMEAKLFGGAAVLAGTPEHSVGTRNVELAFERLRHHGIVVVAHRTGGENGMLIRMFTGTGDVLARPIGRDQV